MDISQKIWGTVKIRKLHWIQRKKFFQMTCIHRNNSHYNIEKNEKVSEKRGFSNVYHSLKTQIALWIHQTIRWIFPLLMLALVLRYDHYIGFKVKFIVFRTFLQFGSKSCSNTTRIPPRTSTQDMARGAPNGYIRCNSACFIHQKIISSFPP